MLDTEMHEKYFQKFLLFTLLQDMHSCCTIKNRLLYLTATRRLPNVLPDKYISDKVKYLQNAQHIKLMYT